MFCAIIANGSDYIAPNKKVNNIIITNFICCFSCQLNLLTQYLTHCRTT